MTTRSITMTGLVTTLATLATSARGRSFATSYSARASNGSSMRWTNSTNNWLSANQDAWEEKQWDSCQVKPVSGLPWTFHSRRGGRKRRGEEWMEQPVHWQVVKLIHIFQSIVQPWVWPHVWFWFIEINSSTALVRERTYTNLWVFGLVTIREATNTGCSVNREKSGCWLLHLATWYQSLHMC